MRKDGRDLRNLGAHLRFQAGHFIVSVLHAELFVEFEMLLHMQMSIQILHADVVHVEVVASGDGPDAVENIFRPARAWNRMHHHVGAR